MKSEFERAITQLSADRNLAPEVILEAIEQSLVLAYKKHFGATQSVVVKIDPRTGAAQVYVAKQVVDEVLDPMVEIDLSAAQPFSPPPSWAIWSRSRSTPRTLGASQRRPPSR